MKESKFNPMKELEARSIDIPIFLNPHKYNSNKEKLIKEF